MKNHLNKKLIVAYIGSRSILAKSFVKHYKNNFIFRSYIGDIRDYNKITKWLIKNRDINIIINFAAITSTKECEVDKKKTLEVNFKSVINLLSTINNIQMNNFNYFLCISTSHVFKKSFNKIKEQSEKKPSNYYGLTKLKLEKYISNNSTNFNFKIGIARIFNYYNINSKKSFFINDLIKKLKNKNRIINFKNINTYRDFVSMEDINTALFRMIKLRLIKDYNICSGQKIYLPDIIKLLNKKIQNKKIILDKKKLPGLIGSNIKLKRKGWRIKKNNFLNDLLK